MEGMRKYQNLPDNEIAGKIAAYQQLRRDVAETDVDSRYRWIDDISKSIHELNQDIKARQQQRSA